MNRSVLAAGTHDPLLLARLEGEVQQMEKIQHGLAQNVFVIPFLTEPPVGLQALRKLDTTTL
jgi:arsenite-transporting ATPase